MEWNSRLEGTSFNYACSFFFNCCTGSEPSQEKNPTATAAITMDFFARLEDIHLIPKVKILEK